MDAPGPSDVFRFGNLRLDTRGGGLFRCAEGRNPAPINIGARALDVLGVLVERHGDLVSKEQIMSAVWPGMVVEESNLAVQISALRRVVDTKGSGASCIQTVPGRGYRFVAPVKRIVATADEPAAAEDEPPAPSGINAARSSARRRTALAIGTVVAVLPAILVAGGLGMSHNWAAQRPVAYSPQDRRGSIIVLPFENSSGDPTQEGVATGITRDLMTDMVAQHPTFPLVPATTAAAYQGKTLDLPTIARDQDVHFVLTGNARRQAGRLIVAVTLYQTEGERAVWSRQYDQPDRPDSWKVVVQSIVSNVDSTVPDVEAARAMREHPDDLDKRDLYLAATAGSWSQLSKEKYLDRIALAERALALDPDYVQALQMAARVRAILVLGGYSSNPELDLARAEKEADRALMLAPDDFWVLVTMATVLRARGKLDEAAALFRRVITLRPAMGARYKDLGRVLMTQGKFNEALETFVTAKQFALGTEPAQVDDTNMAVALVANDRFPEAIGQARLAMAEFSPGSGRDAEAPHLALIAAESLNGQDADARADLRSFLDTPRTLHTMAAIRSVPFLAANTKLLEGLRRAGMPEA
jgi:DNA-binding winged helix-turn-helix (wHTH) protein/TolB-like protein